VRRHEDEDRRCLIDAAVEHGGGIDALVNNAGNMVRGPITDLDERDLRGIFDSQCRGTDDAHGPRRATPWRSEAAPCVFIGSVHTRRSFPGASPYAATKGAVEVLARCWQPSSAAPHPRELRDPRGRAHRDQRARGPFTEAEHQRAHGSARAPARAGRIGTDIEVAEAIEYLITAEWTTGASLVVDGGLALGISNH
jgi:NAD(P)-dependent dehydrogenase (short-subunit alcohol dehydrogenase family)